MFMTWFDLSSKQVVIGIEIRIINRPVFLVLKSFEHDIFLKPMIMWKERER